MLTNYEVLLTPMSEATARREHERSTGYTLLGGAAVLFATGLLLVVVLDRPLALFGAFALAAALLAAPGARSVADARTGDPREAAMGRAFEFAGTVAFWVVASVLLVDAAAGFLPEARVPVAYVYVGGVAFLLAYAYASTR